MKQKNYEANLDTAISYLQLNQKENAIASLNMAYSQVPNEDKTSDNSSYLKILSLAARFALEAGDFNNGANYINKGLSLKNLHADLLFLNILCLREQHKYGEILSNLINYLVAIDMPDAILFSYDFVNEEAINEVYESLIPIAYRNTPNHGPILEVIKDTIEKLKELSGGSYLERAYHIMLSIDRQEN